MEKIINIFFLTIWITCINATESNCRIKLNLFNTDTLIESPVFIIQQRLKEYWIHFVII